MLKSILIVVILAVLFVLAVMFIAKNGGWSSEKGCHGDCSKCHENCDSHRAKVRAAALPAQTPYYINTEETYNGTQSRYQG